MTWLHHRRWSRRVALLAAGALEGRERARTLAHMERCSACAGDCEGQAAIWHALAADPACAAEPPISLAALRARVHSHLDGQVALPRRGGLRLALETRWLVSVGAAAAVVALVVGWLVRTGPVPASQPTQEARVEVSVEMLASMERHLARERAARYLAEARDVLVHVASESPRCDRRRKQIDVADEQRRSRELLVRRALLVDVEAPSVAPARGVLEDVERTLRTVAALDPCCDPEAIVALRSELASGRLLMKIELVSRELVG